MNVGGIPGGWCHSRYRCLPPPKPGSAKRSRRAPEATQINDTKPHLYRYPVHFPAVNPFVPNAPELVHTQTRFITRFPSHYNDHGAIACGKPRPSVGARLDECQGQLVWNTSAAQAPHTLLRTLEGRLVTTQTDRSPPLHGRNLARVTRGPVPQKVSLKGGHACSPSLGMCHSNHNYLPATQPQHNAYFRGSYANLNVTLRQF